MKIRAMLEEKINALLQQVPIQYIENKHLHGVQLDILREDLIHPAMSGNKLRKLKYNLLEAEKQGKNKLLTFGGAYSNHIAATAAAGKIFGFQTTGIIRGEEITPETNKTLQTAAENGMDFRFVSRSEYRSRNTKSYMDALSKACPDHYIIPEGGSNALGVLGCTEILSAATTEYDIIAVPCGTGTTLAGLILSAAPGQRIIGFSSLKGNFLKKEVEQYIYGSVEKNDNWEINSSYNFGGYARITQPLIDFISSLYLDLGIFAEPIYTGKMLYGLYHMISEGIFPVNTKILAVHTGGLQGWHGFSQHLPSGI